jgi:hypothetical protein
LSGEVAEVRKPHSDKATYQDLATNRKLWDTEKEEGRGLVPDGGGSREAELIGGYSL